MSVKQNGELQNECQEKPKLRTFIRFWVNSLLYNNAYAIFKTQIFSTFSALKSCDKVKSEQGAINGQGKRINNGSVRMGYL